MPDRIARIKLLYKQTKAWEVWESENITELGYGGGAGGGKTRLGCYLCITIAEQYPGSRGAIGRKELKTLRLTTLAELFLIFSELGYQKEVVYVYDAKDSIIKFPNSSEILLLDTAYSPQDPEYTRFGSLNLTWCWIEESNETPEKAKNILKVRIGRNNKFMVQGKEIIVKPFWLETFNPNKGHVYKDYYKPWKEKKLLPYRQFISALVGDNPYLPRAYITALERADPITKARLLKGNFDYDSDPTRIINYDAILDLKTNTLNASNKKYLINDIARFGGDKIIFGEFEGLYLVGLEIYKYQDLEKTKEKIKERSRESKIPYSQILTDEDGMGGGVVDGLPGTKGFLGNARPLDIWDTLHARMSPANFVNLRSQCYFKLADLVNNHQVAIKLQYFKTNIEGYSQDQAIADLEEELDHIKRIDNSGQNTKMAIIPKDDIKEEISRSPDLADVMMMRMLFYLQEPEEEVELNYYDRIWEKELQGAESGGPKIKKER